MSTQTEPIEKISHLPSQPRVILHNISWQTYQSLLTDLADQSAPHLNYNQGTLEIMSPLSEHETLTSILEQFINAVAEELEVDVKCFRSTTFKRKDLARGFEADSSYYIQHESNISGKTDIDLTIDPPPDLIIEVDITSGSLNKFGIYAKIGVPEIWRHNGKELTIYQLTGEEYITVSNSLALPLINSVELTEFIAANAALKSTVFLRTLREWVRARR